MKKENLDLTCEQVNLVRDAINRSVIPLVDQAVKELKYDNQKGVKQLLIYREIVAHAVYSYAYLCARTKKLSPLDVETSVSHIAQAVIETAYDTQTREEG